jgi:ribosomal protein L3 glutamine methyltransferase
MADEHLQTLRDVLRHAVSRFNAAGIAFGHGTQDAFDDAAYLLLHTLHLPLDKLDPFLDARLSRAEVAQLLQVVERRAGERLPAPYITQEAWLQGYRFHVDERVIVPRSFIAELLKDGLSPWIEDADAVGSVLDLCTGSGCLAIMAADVFAQAAVDAVDVSADALAVAQRNVEAYGLQERVRLVRSDLYASLAGARYDVILCNPPYVNEASMQALPAEYRHEPRLALAGGEDGMDLVRTIVGQAARHLNDEGWLILEIGHERPYFEAAFAHLQPTWLTTSAGDDMVLALRRDQLPPA